MSIYVNANNVKWTPSEKMWTCRNGMRGEQSQQSWISCANWVSRLGIPQRISRLCSFWFPAPQQLSADCQQVQPNRTGPLRPHSARILSLHGHIFAYRAYISSGSLMFFIFQFNICQSLKHIETNTNTLSASTRLIHSQHSPWHITSAPAGTKNLRGLREWIRWHVTRTDFQGKLWGWLWGTGTSGTSGTSGAGRPSFLYLLPCPWALLCLCPCPFPSCTICGARSAA